MQTELLATACALLSTLFGSLAIWLRKVKELKFSDLFNKKTITEIVKNAELKLKAAESLKQTPITN